MCTASSQAQRECLINISYHFVLTSNTFFEDIFLWLDPSAGEKSVTIKVPWILSNTVLESSGAN